MGHKFISGYLETFYRDLHGELQQMFHFLFLLNTFSFPFFKKLLGYEYFLLSCSFSVGFFLGRNKKKIKGLKIFLKLIAIEFQTITASRERLKFLFGQNI